MAVGGAGAHFGAVGGQPRDFETRIESRFGQYFAEQQNALSAEACDADVKIDGICFVLYDRDVGLIVVDDSEDCGNLFESRSRIRGRCAVRDLLYGRRRRREDRSSPSHRGPSAATRPRTSSRLWGRGRELRSLRIRGRAPGSLLPAGWPARLARSACCHRGRCARCRRERRASRAIRSCVADSLRSRCVRPRGVVVLFCPISVVGAAWPPVML